MPKAKAKPKAKTTVAPGTPAKSVSKKSERKEPFVPVSTSEQSAGCEGLPSRFVRYDGA